MLQKVLAPSEATIFGSFASVDRFMHKTALGKRSWFLLLLQWGLDRIGSCSCALDKSANMHTLTHFKHPVSWHLFCSLQFLALAALYDISLEVPISSGILKCVMGKPVCLGMSLSLW